VNSCDIFYLKCNLSIKIYNTIVFLKIILNKIK
jgi:hypothetical protein